MNENKFITLFSVLSGTTANIIFKNLPLALFVAFLTGFVGVIGQKTCKLLLLIINKKLKRSYKMKRFLVNLKQRFYNNYKTTTAGIIIIIVCLILVYQAKATFTEVAGFLTMALLFFGLKDPRNNEK